MQNITNILINAFQSNGHNPDKFEVISKKIKTMQLQFYEDEQSSWETSNLKAPKGGQAIPTRRHSE